MSHKLNNEDSEEAIVTKLTQLDENLNNNALLESDIHFQDRIKENIDVVQRINRTYLQISCREELLHVTKWLIDNEADIYRTTLTMQETPLEIACFIGNQKLTELLLEDQHEEREPEEYRRSLCKGLCHVLHRKVEAKACYEILLEKIKKFEVDTEKYKDRLGKTAFYYAKYYNLSDVEVDLLSNNQFIISEHLDKIEPETLQKFFDKCVTIEKENTNNEIFIKLSLNYEMLCNPDKGETRIIHSIFSYPKFQDFVTHPLILCFILMKWNSMFKSIFAINIAYWIAHLAFLCWCALHQHNDDDDFGYTIIYIIAAYLFIYVMAPVIFGFLSQISQEPEFKDLIKNRLASFALKIKDFGNFRFASFALKIRDFGNWIANKLAFFIYVYVLCVFIFGELTQRTLALSIAVLFFSFKIILLSRMYLQYGELFKIIFFNYSKILGFYILTVLLPFAIINFATFHRTKKDKNYTFHNFTSSFFELFVLLTGKIANDELFSNNALSSFDLSRYVYIVYVFIFTLVIFNLLTSQAVYDIQELKKRAKIVCLLEKIKFFFNSEDFFRTVESWGVFSHSLTSKLRRVTSKLRRVTSKLRVFPDDTFTIEGIINTFDKDSKKVSVNKSIIQGLNELLRKGQFSEDVKCSIFSCQLIKPNSCMC